MPELAALLAAFVEVRIIATPAALHFFKREDLPPTCSLLGESPGSVEALYELTLCAQGHLRFTVKICWRLDPIWVPAP